MSKILMGSQYFFSCYSDFHSKDIDYIEIIETNEFKHKRQMTGKNKCLFQLKYYPNKMDYINWDLQSNCGMTAGKYLISEFCAAIGFTIADLPLIKPLIDILDLKHQYEKIIYESYLQNNAFYLTDEQRQNAYQIYKETRGK